MTARDVTLRLLAVAIGVALGAIAVELALRLSPRMLPAGVYGVSGYRADLRSNVHGAHVIYNKVGFVERDPNADGYLDVAHALAKPRGVVRVGFFGDSYVEAIQVPLEEVFHRRLARELADDEIEPLGFGMSGWGTLNAYLAYRIESARYDVDAAVYVFVENDLGDNSLEIHDAHSTQLTPHAVASLDDSPLGFRIVSGDPASLHRPAYRAAKLVQERSLLARLLWNRISILRARPAPASRRADGPPLQDDLPSSWAPGYRERAEELGRRILAAWHAEAVRDGRPLLLLYVPRDEVELSAGRSEADSWRPWVLRTCGELGIPVIDPTAPLLARARAGNAVYADHWTAAGHEVIAATLSPELKRIARELRATLR